MTRLQALTWNQKKHAVTIIDQRALPRACRKIVLRTARDVFYAIRTLAVRGAPLIGIAAGFGLYLGIKKYRGDDARAFFRVVDKNIAYLKSSRPTAVNLERVLVRIRKAVAVSWHSPVSAIKARVLEEAQRVLKEEEVSSCAMGRFASALIRKNDTVLTHCNTGFLATAGYGTALAGIYFAHAQKKNILVHVDETRPLLQGARLTYWELSRRKIKAVLNCDNMAGYLMAQGRIDKVFVGADRIALNGDTANKIGTYSLAVLARAHRVPFYVVAPTSTFDVHARTGTSFPIEHRNADEVRNVFGAQIAPRGATVYNPSFDVTPARYISAIITEKGVARGPFKKSIARLLRQ
jgi:methylthioribose-1-phosphate isomerase